MMMGFGLLGTILVIALGTVLVIALVVYLIGLRSNGDRGWFGNSGQKQSPREILEERYARGEISKKEYDQMHEDLS